MSAEHAFLVVDRKVLPCRRGPDGALVADPAGFEDQAVRQRRLKDAEAAFNLRQQQAASHHPERVAAIWDAWERRLISTTQAADLVSSGRVDDRGWAWLGEIVQRGEQIPDEPEFDHVACWTADIRSPGKARQPAFDPLEHQAEEVPVAVLARLLDELSADGWEVIHVSEDRGISTDEVSYVLTMRYLLRRSVAS